jgi:hypothetical protein
MTKLRPGLGSYTPNWGTHDDRVFETSVLGQRPQCVSLRHLSDPATLDWPPAGDRRINIEPEGVRPRLRQHRLNH